MSEKDDQIKKLRMLALLQAEAPPVDKPFFHYCSAATFLKIVKSRSIWASHHTSMEDDSETRVFFNVLIERANQKRNVTSEKIFENFLSYWELNLKDYYISSFSVAKDLDYQWKNYGDKGRGVCIGFFPQSFGVPGRIPYYSELGTNIGIFEVNYLSETQYAIADLILDLIQMDGLQNFYPSVERFSLALKGAEYAKEKEIRIVEIQDSRLLINPDAMGYRTMTPERHYNYRLKNGVRVPYREFRFNGHLHSVSLRSEAEISSIEIKEILEESKINVANGILCAPKW